MNITPKERQIQVLKALVERNSIRSIERMTGIHRDTIMRLLVRVGDKCQKIMDTQLKNFHCRRIQADEIWTFIKKKEKHLTDKERLDPTVGDQFVFVAMDADTKLISVFTVGKRNTESTFRFMIELDKKLAGNGRIQLTTDGFRPYVDVVERIFGPDVDFAQLIKFFATEFAGSGRYSPPKVTEVLSKVINGNPNPKHISTSYVERQNLTMRMRIRRFTRLTNGFSKKIENLKATLALHFAHYNFMRIHKTLRVTPAMEAGITDHVWEWEEMCFF